MRFLPLTLVVCLTCTICPVNARDNSCGPLPQATPESVGLSTARLNAMTEHFRREASQNSAAGYVLLVARYGKLVHSRAVGFRNIEQRQAMTLDTRFRIASMTKPITSVAVLMLYEEGRFQLDDPIARFLPEFANPRVYTGTDAQGNLTSEPAKRGITIRDLLTHTSGLGYGELFDPPTPLRDAYEALKLRSPGKLADKVRQIASLPLYYQPGSDWRYSYAHDVLGRLVEVVSGVSFEKFLNDRLFSPLKMTSTGFYMPPSAKLMLATIYKHDAQGALQPSQLPWILDASDTTRSPSGGGGLISTAGDYLRFAQMLEFGGSLEGRQYLSPTTVDLMTQSQVAEDVMFKYWGANSIGLGYGLGIGVELDTRHAPHAGYPGDFNWDGLFDTHWLASPKTGLVAVLMTQVDRSGNKSPQRTEPDFHNLLYAAVTTLRVRESPSARTARTCAY